MSYNERRNLNILVGQTLRGVYHDKEKEAIFFLTEDGTSYVMMHNQDCCECVIVESIVGDLQDLVGTPILVAEERTTGERDGEKFGSVPDYIYIEAWRTKPGNYGGSDSETWTFYTFRTIKGSVDIRWHGSSNGYYSESVDFECVRSESD
jgi:hypothetical protein